MSQKDVLKIPTFNGQRLKALRQEKDWPAEEVARRAGVSARHVWRLETNARPNVAAITVGRLAIALGTSMEYLLGLTDDATGQLRQSLSRQSSMSRFADLQQAIDHAIAAAKRTAEIAEVCGEYPDELPYDDLERLLTTALEEVRFFRSHAHEWGDDLRCIHCGSDGLA